MLVVIHPPCLDLLLGLLERMEPVQIQAFLLKFSVEDLYEIVLNRFPQTNKIKLCPVSLPRSGVV
jgi:hypothetical protein